VTVAVIYRHFESKEDLYRAVLEEQWAGMLAHQRDRVFSSPPGLERLRAAYDAYFEWFESHPLAARLIFREGTGPESVVDAHEAVLERATDAIMSYLLGARAGESRRTRDPGVQLVAEFLKGGTNTVGRWWLDNPGLSRDEVVDRLVELTWSGLAPLGAEGRLMEALRRPRPAG
jgi:AcrR family transcriptional regulator